jgi:hypothetical protein
MEKKLTINPLGNEITIREGKSIDPKDPVKIEISGTLRTCSDFYKPKAEQFDPQNCHVTIDVNALEIIFFGDEKDHFRTIIKGSLKTFSLLNKFGINNEKKFSSIELAKLLRRHPFLFDDDMKVTWDKLILAMLNFKAKINTIIENEQDMKGNRKYLLEKTVEQSIPDSIVFTCPIFEGEQNLSFKVEICCEATSNDVEFYLDSPDLYILFENESRRLLKEQSDYFAAQNIAVLYL